MKKTLKKSLALFLVIIFILTIPLTTFAGEIGFEQIQEENKTPTQLVEQISWEDKISDELWGAMGEVGDGEKIPVDIWYTDIDYEEVEQDVERATGLNADRR